MREEPFDNLIKSLTRLPGLGPRSARRIALHLLTNKEDILKPLIDSLSHAAESINKCEVCYNLDLSSPCYICKDYNRPKKTLCIIASVADLWAIERTGAFKDQYHILGGVLSALDGIGPNDLNIDSLIERVQKNEPLEIILALNATVDGQATAHYLTDKLQNITTAKISRLAHGVPIGGELDFLDDGTITTALKSRAAL